MIPIYVFYWKGPIVRERSKFAQSLVSDREKRGGGTVETEREGRTLVRWGREVDGLDTQTGSSLYG